MLIALSLLVVPGHLPVTGIEDRQAGIIVARQIRVERRIIIRVPRGEEMLRSGFAPARSVPAVRLKEKRMDRCVPVRAISGMRRAGERTLDLLLSDSQMVRAYLDDDCSSRDFYSGLYIERARDGRLCAGRDMLHSRSGAKCEIDRFRRLIPRK